MKRRAARAWMLAAALAGAASARAQDVQVSASVNRSAVALNDQIVLQVTVGGNLTDLPEPQLPSMPNFNAYSSGRSHNLSIVNGQIHSSAVYTYVLTPRFVGRAVIGPIAVETGGKRYTTGPIEIVVERPSQPAPGSPGAPQAAPPPSSSAQAAPAVGRRGDDIFVRASVDKAEAFVNEQVNLTVRFYTAVPLMGNPEYNPPQLQGVLSEDLPPNRNGQETQNGRTYYYTEIKTALFPVEPGQARVSPGVIKAQVQGPDGGVDPFAPDFFQRFFSQGLAVGQEREVRSEPLAIKVKPLPQEGRPASFKGAVGRFTVGASLDKRELKVGEALNLVFTVRGEGNLKTASAPDLPDLPDCRVYDSVSSLSLEKAEDVVRSVKEFKTVLVPKVSGTLTIPPIRYAVFEPRRGAYVEKATPEMVVRVLPGAAPAASPIPSTGAAPEALAVAADIRYIHETAGRPRLDSLLYPLGRHRAWHLIPFLLFLVCALGRQALELASRDPAGARARRALSRARGAVREAEREFERQNIVQAAARLSEALSGYLSDRLGPEVQGLPFRKCVETLSRRHPGLRAETGESLKKVWDEIDLLRFSPGTEQQVQPLAETVLAVLNAVEKETRP